MSELSIPAGGRNPDQSKGRRLPSVIRSVLSPLIPEGTNVALFDFPNHSNVGDSAIWLGEIAFLKSLPGVRIRYVTSRTTPSTALPELPASWIVLLHGGGNMGDLWPQHQSFRERLVLKYRSNRVIQLPQSVFFADQSNALICRKAFQTHPDLHLLVRDNESLCLASQLHDGPKYLCPDMAFCLTELNRTKSPTESIVGLLRTDKEKNVAIQTRLPNNGLVAFDWISEPKSLTRLTARHLERVERIYSDWMPAMHPLKQSLFDRLAWERLRRGCNLLSTGKVVITDRLHAHILCCLMEIPHVVLDNNYGKIANFRNTWGSGGRGCVATSSIDEAISQAQSLIAC